MEGIKMAGNLKMPVLSINYFFQLNLDLLKPPLNANGKNI
jgi:hypothetical protein